MRKNMLFGRAPPKCWTTSSGSSKRCACTSSMKNRGPFTPHFLQKSCILSCSCDKKVIVVGLQRGRNTARANTRPLKPSKWTAKSFGELVACRPPE